MSSGTPWRVFASSSASTAASAIIRRYFSREVMMRLLAIFLLLFQLLVGASNGWAQGGKDRVIEMKGGERVVLRA
ncbi:hypothetical protein, partial [Roseateles sp.]|uniref:hypothetical protein n=1 Tax=Roseateles sp. TaxID=1971397 RepID=UPI00286BBB12